MIQRYTLPQSLWTNLAKSQDGDLMHYADHVRELAALREALRKAVRAAEYVVQIVEANDKAGQSPNPFEKADWVGTCGHAYAAMAFVNEARAALNQESEKPNEH